MDVLEMRRHRHGTQVIVSLSGEVDADNVTRMRRGLDEAVAARSPECPRLVVDLSDLTFIDTTGLGALVRLRAHVTDGDNALALVAPDGQVLRRLRRTNLAPLFSIYETLSQALT